MLFPPWRCFKQTPSIISLIVSNCPSFRWWPGCHFLPRGGGFGVSVAFAGPLATTRGALFVGRYQNLGENLRFRLEKERERASYTSKSQDLLPQIVALIRTCDIKMTTLIVGICWNQLWTLESICVPWFWMYWVSASSPICVASADCSPGAVACPGRHSYDGPGTKQRCPKILTNHFNHKK